jgi:Tfp pilus assembly protein PilW
MLTREQQQALSLDDDAGFMLIELLVAMISATVVTGALFAILIVSLHQNKQIDARVQATELGRPPMTRIVDELHSACIAKESEPIQAGSSASKLIFVSGVGGEAVLSKAYKHTISYSSGEGTLTEATEADSGGEWPTFKFESGTTTTKRIAEYISPAKYQTEELPIFRYYKYAEKSSSTGAVTNLEPLPIAEPTKGLTTTQAKEAAAVQINYTAGAPEGKQYKPTIELTAQVTLAFTAPSAETPIVQKPCE